MTLGHLLSGLRPSWFQTASEAKSAPRRLWIAGYLLTFLFLSAGIGIVGHYLFAYQVATSCQEAENELSAVGNLKVQRIIEWRRERLSGADQIMVDPFAGQCVEQFMAGSAQDQRRSSLLAWLRSIQEHNQGLRTLLVDPQMNVRLAFSRGQYRLRPHRPDVRSGIPTLESSDVLRSAQKPRVRSDPP